MTVLENIFAPVLLGTWFNSMIYTLELLLVYLFYAQKKSDGQHTLLMRCMVGLLLVADTAGSMGNAAYAYLMLVKRWGDLSFLALNPLPGAVDCITSSFSGFVVQLYLIWRFSILSKNYVVCGILVLGAMTSLGGGIGTGIASLLHREVSQRQKIVPITTVWFAASVATDVCIAAALVFQLRSYDSGFQSTRSMVHRLIVNAVQTGSATATVSIVVLVTFAVRPNTAIALAPGFIVGRVYTCTLLFNLTARRRMGEATNRTVTNVSGEASQWRVAAGSTQTPSRHDPLASVSMGLAGKVLENKDEKLGQADTHVSEFGYRFADTSNNRFASFWGMARSGCYGRGIQTGSRAPSPSCNNLGLLSRRAGNMDTFLS
ncbi:hypothetical protein MIND_01343500 [Mycena indigotica]|uniref:DUF6534 domain-containing protein n=1 Tax=Mycena indigotica TaxID=2126181 RepID=A0A8H6VVE5_9AGAR|nr:uncharacterized protein MIND_01343500 [Mycena indigotica]KAF7289704.1 hypothetical protein MIND_01343500 [Mycena indigotica]